MRHWNVRTSANMMQLATKLRGTLIGCTDSPSRGVGAPHQCPRVNETRSGREGGGGLSRTETLPVMEACSH